MATDEVSRPWLDTIAKATEPLEAAEGFPACVLLTDPILSGQLANCTIDSVKFVVKSNDQGWCSEDSFEGIYEGSWTWFEVAILRPPQPGEATISSRDRRSIHTEPCIKQALDRNKISTNLRFYTKGESGSIFWHLQRNRRGVDEPMKHTITWTRNSKESANERLGWDFNPIDGAGSGEDFVKLLQKGDRVAVIARAKQSGSVNYVSEATVEIYVEGPEPVNDNPAGSLTQADPNSVPSNTPAHIDALGPDAETLGNPGLNFVSTIDIEGGGGVPPLAIGTNPNTNVDPQVSPKTPAESKTTEARANGKLDQKEQTPTNTPASPTRDNDTQARGPGDSAEPNVAGNDKGAQLISNDSKQGTQDIASRFKRSIGQLMMQARRSISRKSRGETVTNPGDAKPVGGSGATGKA